MADKEEFSMCGLGRVLKIMQRVRESNPKDIDGMEAQLPLFISPLTQPTPMSLLHHHVPEKENTALVGLL